MLGNPRHQGIGHEMRTARESKGLQQAEMAGILGVSKGALSKYENGKLRVKPSLLTRFLLACDATPELIAELVEAITKPDQDQWLAVDLLDHRRQQAALLEIERSATRISSVSPMVVSGMLQTSDYARAVMRDADVSANEIEPRVVARRGRRDAITERDVQLNSYLTEAALHAEIGGRDVMLRQLEFLLVEQERDNVNIRIIPVRGPWHPAMDGAFTFLESGESDPVVHVENRISGLFLHLEHHVAVYRRELDKVRQRAMSVSDSTRLIAEVITQMKTETTA